MITGSTCGNVQGAPLAAASRHRPSPPPGRQSASEVPSLPPAVLVLKPAAALAAQQLPALLASLRRCLPAVWRQMRLHQLAALRAMAVVQLARPVAPAAAAMCTGSVCRSAVSQVLR